jgi:hypothetical protein
MRTSLGEFDAILRHRRESDDGEPVDGRHLALPDFLFDQSGRLPGGEHDRSLARVRYKGWIGPDGQLDQQWQEITDVLGRASVWAFLEVAGNGEQWSRAMVAVRRNSARMVVLDQRNAHVDEARPDAPWPALVGCLPARPAAEGSAITVDGPTWSAASSAAAQFLADGGDGIALTYELRQRDVPDADARAVGAMLREAGPVSARMTVAIRDARDEVRPLRQAIRVRHTPTGRVAEVPRGREVVLTPADDQLLAQTLQDCVEELVERYEVAAPS